MPTVRLSYHECWRGLLPRVCAACGAPTGNSVRFAIPTRFLFYVALPITGWMPPLCVAVLFYLRTRAMHVPMCDRHCAEWKRWDRRMDWSYLIVVGTAFTAAVLLLVCVPSEWVDPWWNFAPWEDAKWLVIPLAYLAVLMAWTVPVSLRQTRYVRITQATARDIRLSGVHAGFVQAVREDRAGDPDPARMALFGDARDDYDDDVN